MKHFQFWSLAALLVLFTAPALAAPSASRDEVLKVYVTVGVLDIDAINSAEQNFTLNLIAQFRWHDPSLAHDGETTVRRQLTEIPAPGFILLNRQRTWSSLLSVVDISPEGEVIYRLRLWGDFSQIMRLQEFPFDSHNFEIPIVAIHHAGNRIEMLLDPESESFIANEFSVADWTISEWSAEPRLLDILEDDATPSFVFSFRAERISQHYLIKYIVPLFLIVAMSWVVFWIDPSESGSQLSVAVTAMLTLIAYHIASQWEVTGYILSNPYGSIPVWLDAGGILQPCRSGNHQPTGQTGAIVVCALDRCGVPRRFSGGLSGYRLPIVNRRCRCKNVRKLV